MTGGHDQHRILDSINLSRQNRLTSQPLVLNERSIHTSKWFPHANNTFNPSAQQERGVQLDHRLEIRDRSDMVTSRQHPTHTPLSDIEHGNDAVLAPDGNKIFAHTDTA